jgi:methylthioribose-1-phosphate isomerase
MNVNGRHYRTIWLNTDGWAVDIIDQTKFPHVFETVTLRSPEEAAIAIKDMLVRGAPLIGVTAAYGMALAMRQDGSDEAMKNAYELLVRTQAHRHQPQMGARRDGPRAEAAAAGQSACRSLCARGRHRG